MRRPFPLFYKILISFVAVFLIALTVCLFVIHAYLAEYESVQPYKVVEETIETYFKTSDKQLVIEKSGYELPDFTTRALVEEKLSELVSNSEITYYSVTPSDGADASYAIVAKDLKIAVVDLVKCIDKSDKGFDKYMLSGIRLTIGSSGALTVSASDDVTVFINGRPVGEEYIVGEPEKTLSWEHMHDDVSGITIVTYRIEGLFDDPDITARSKNGISLPVIKKDGDKPVYEVPLTYDEPTEEMRNLILDASEAYAAYMQKDAPFNRIAKYVYRNCDLYTDLRTSDIRWVNEHTGYEIEDPEISELYYYDENTFSCRVTFVHVLTGGYGGTYRNVFDMTYYFRFIDGSWLIYDSQVN